MLFEPLRLQKYNKNLIYANFDDIFRRSFLFSIFYPLFYAVGASIFKVAFCDLEKLHFTQ